MKIKDIKALEFLDSRGRPTVATTIFLDDGTKATAMVPSGASTGKHEALELRDGDPKHYFGKGVTKAIENVKKVIAPKIIGKDAGNQEGIDKAMIDLDGSENKSNLGANAILSISLAISRVAAKSNKMELYEYLGMLYTGKKKSTFKLPTPMVNVINGGAHAKKSTDIQEYLLIPSGAKTCKDSIRMSAEVFHFLGKILEDLGFQSTVGDEGGYAPSLERNEKAFEILISAIEKAGYKPGNDFVLAIDAAASEFFENGKYNLKTENKILDTKGLLEVYEQWTKKYPLVSIEDGFSEDDWDGFSLMQKNLGDKIQNVGDDLYVTNIKRLEKGIETKATNSILIKLNQIGTLTETLNVIKTAKQAGLTTIISHRSGETEDTFIADLAVATEAGQIKTGSMSRSERIAKYNRLIAIENILGKNCSIANFPFN